MSAFKAVRAVTNPSTSKVWLGDTSAWPIIGVISAAVAVCAGTSIHYLTHSPDVQWDRTARASTVRMNFAEGSRWSSHKAGLSVGRDGVAKVGLMPGLNQAMGK